jgi:hypothetical protein
MAQADSVPSSTRQLITGESANQSTSLRAIKPPAALKLPVVSVQPVDRYYLIGGSDARVIVGANDAPLLWFWRERRSDAHLEDLSNCRWYAASTGHEPWARTSGLCLSRPLASCWGGCSGTFSSCFGSGRGISSYGQARSTGCHQTGWPHRSHRGGRGEHGGRTKPSQIK